MAATTRTWTVHSRMRSNSVLRRALDKNGSSNAAGARNTPSNQLNTATSGCPPKSTLDDEVGDRRNDDGEQHDQRHQCKAQAVAAAARRGIYLRLEFLRAGPVLALGARQLLLHHVAPAL